MKLKTAFTLVALAVALAAAGGYWLGSRNASTVTPGGTETAAGRKVLYWYDPMAPVPVLINRANRRLWIWTGSALCR